jgi:hypothetical protein
MPSGLANFLVDRAHYLTIGLVVPPRGAAYLSS